MKLHKETEGDHKVHGRWYHDACGGAFAMELIGERWSFPIIRELMLGGRRFSDIRASLPGISAKVLTERLAGLEASGIVTREATSAPAPAKLYALTAWGLALEPVMQELGRWSVQSRHFDPTLPLTPVSLMLSLRTMIDPHPPRDWMLNVRFEVAAERFTGRLANGELRIARATAQDGAADITFRALHPNAYLPVFYGKRSLESPGITLTAQGDAAIIQRFIDLFALPHRRERAH